MDDGDVRHVPLDDMDLFVHQSRGEFDEETIRQLAENIKLNSQLQPGVAWLDPGRNRLVLICGERRYRALKLAGLKTMAVTVRQGPMTPGQMLQINLAENIQRESINAIERGKAFRRLMQLERLTATQVAERMNVSNATVSRDMSLLDLPPALQAKVASGELPASVATHIARLDDDDTRRALVEKYSSGELNRSGVAAEVNAELRPGERPARTPRVAWKLGGLSFSVSGREESLNLDLLLKVLKQLQEQANSLKKAGKSHLADLADVLKPS